MKITKIAATINKQQNLQKNTSSPIEQQAQQKDTSFLSNISFSGYSKLERAMCYTNTSGKYFYYDKIDLGENKDIKEIKEIKAPDNSYERRIYYLDIDENIDMNKIPNNTNYIVQYKQPENHKFELLQESALNPKDYFSLNYDNHIKYIKVWQNQVLKYRSKVMKRKDGLDNSFAKGIMNIQIKSNDEKLDFINQKLDIYNKLANNTNRIKTCVDLQIDYNKTLENIQKQKQQIGQLQIKITEKQNQIAKIETELNEKIKDIQDKMSKSPKEEKAEHSIILKFTLVEKQQLEDKIVKPLKIDLDVYLRKLAEVEQWLADSLAYIDKVDASDDFKNRETIISNSLKNIKNIYQEHFPECLE